MTVGEAEALAAVLQEAERATVVGVPTFGEGSDYSFVELEDWIGPVYPYLQLVYPRRRLGRR